MMKNKLTKKIVYSHPGSKLVPQTEMVYSDEKRKNIVQFKKEKRDLHSEIVESRSLTDLAILKRSALTGGVVPSVLKNYVAGIDMTKMPKDVNQLHNMADFNERFKALSPEVRAVFGNDSQKFEKAIKEGTAKNLIKEHFKKVAEKATKEADE